MRPKVFYYPINQENISQTPKIARKLLETVIRENKIKLGKELPLKVHPGNPGNISFIRSENFVEIIKYLQSRKIKTYYIETNQALGGERDNASVHIKIARKHGFTQLPFIIADGENGFDHVLVKIKTGRHFKECKIASKLATAKQIIVLSHFKGHISTGFAGAIKMLALGFASGRGKTEMHSKKNLGDHEPLNWKKIWSLYLGKEFRERSAEYALAACQNKQFIYITFALNIVKNCDCDGQKMKPIYENLGIFASLDPVAIDKAVFDMLAEREHKKPFSGEDIFPYAEKIGLGSQKYELISIETFFNVV